jgi:hypothetical protein
MLCRFAGYATLILVLEVPAALAQDAVTADQLVARNLEARGGADRLESLKSVQFNGTVTFPGDFKLDYKEIRARGAAGPDKVRVDAALQGLTVVSAYDGRTGWRINPFEGRRDAERMSEDEARSQADSGSLAGPLLAARAEGARVSYLGREDFDGTETYKLKVVQKDGDEFVYLIDPDTWLEIKVIETRRLRGSPQVTETELGDYEPVGGVMFPMSVESWQARSPGERQRLMLASAVANPPAPDALFVMPASPAATTGTSSTTGQTDAQQSGVPQPPPKPEPPKNDQPPTTPPNSNR